MALIAFESQLKPANSKIELWLYMLIAYPNFSEFAFLMDICKK